LETIMTKTILAPVLLALGLTACAAGPSLYSDEGISQSIFDAAAVPCYGGVTNADRVHYRGQEARMARCKDGTIYVMTRNASGGWDVGTYNRRTDSVTPFPPHAPYQPHDGD
jgi:hypothetical protein